MKLERLSPLLLVAWVASACGEEPRSPGAELTPAAARTTRQEIRSGDKVLILGTSVNGGINSPEAQAVRDFWPLAPGRGPVTIDVKDATQWAAMTPEQFMSYYAIIIGDASCTSGTAAFQAAIDNKDAWSQIIDGDVVILGTNPSSGSKPQLMRNGIEHVIRNSMQFRTGLYVSLGCAYQNAPANTPVPLLSWLGDFKVQGSGSNCAATTGHMFEVSPPFLSHFVWQDDAYLGNGGCAARSVFTIYPFKNFAVAAIGVGAPGSQQYIDYTEFPGFEQPYFGTPYILVRGATSGGAGCGGDPNNVPAGEECDLGDNGNGVPSHEGFPPASETCSYSCHVNWCGDGVVDNIFGEECDNGDANGRTLDSNGTLVNGMCSKSCKIVNLPRIDSPPVARCTNVTVNAPSNACGAPADINNGSTDPDGDLDTCTQSPAGPYNVGNTAVTLTCRDRAGNTASCTGTVTVRDVTPPTVNIGTPIRSVQCSTTASYTDLSDITASDLCSNPATLLTRTGTVNMRVPGTYTLTYPARDAATPTPNTGSATRTVTVIDTTAPNITLNLPTTMALECGTAYVDPGWDTTDTCYGPLNSSVVVTGTVNSNAVGTYPLQYNLTDPSGNAAAQKTRTVNVRDTTRPVVTLLGPLSQPVQCNDPAYQDPGATASDTCAGTLPATPVTPPNTGAPGTYSITYRATDPSGNVGTSPNSRTVTVEDTLPPVVTLNGSAAMLLECADPWTDPGATARDQCVGNWAVTGSPAVNNRQLGPQTVNYTATDPQGLSDSKTRTVTVSDTRAPVVTPIGPLTQTVECNDPTPYQDPGASVSEACDPTSPTAVPINPPNTGAPGTYSISYQATDRAGNVGTSATRRTVTVQDTLPPIVTLNGAAAMSLECATPWNDPGATANDQCAGSLTGLIQVTGAVNNMQPGPYSLHYSVTDPSGRSDSKDRAVTVRDTLAPNIMVQGPLNDSVECGQTYADPGATANDACAGTVSVTATRTGNPGQPGAFTISYSATDPSGNSITSPVTRTVSVDDDTPPTLVLQGSANPSVECGTSWTDPWTTASDLCSGDLTAAITREGSPSTGIVGSYLLTYRVTDGAGLSATPVTRTVNVGDTLAPSITVLGPLSQAVQCNHAPYADPGATASDLCAGNLAAAIVTTGSVNTGAAGTYTLSYRATDPSGNTTTAGDSRTVTVVDDQPPSISLNGPATGTHECGSPYNDPGATASDLCAGDLTANIQRSGAVSTGTPGSYTLNYTVTDPSNLSASTSRQVTVNDTLAPVLSMVGPAIQNVECGPGYQDPGATATDACAGNLDAQIVMTGAADSTVVGDYSVSYTVSDNAGNTAGPLSRQVRVRDTVVPTITVNGALDQQFECGSSYVDPGATASDVCAGNVAVTATRTGNSTTPGTFTIEYSATDPSGNSTTSPEVRTVHVNDNAPPTLVLVGPDTQTLECGNPWSDPGATANDECFGDLTASITRSGNVNSAAPGNYPVGYNVTDGAGNSAPSVSRTVQVRDTTLPVITILGPLSDSYECGTTYEDPGATAADTCAGDLTSAIVATRSSEPGSLASFTITYSVTDPSGNTAVSSVSRTVTMNDDTPPSIMLNGPNPMGMECAEPFDDPGATANDLCQGDVTNSVTVEFNGVDNMRVGSYLVRYKAIDNSGHEARINRGVEVNDTVGPVLSVTGAPSVELECGSQPDLGVQANDACFGILPASAITATPAILPSIPGEYDVTYSATDPLGNTASSVVTRRFKVADTTEPVMEVYGPPEQQMECGSRYVEPGASAEDSCEGDLSDAIQVRGNLDTDVVGTYVLTYEVADYSNNRVSSERRVTVVDTRPPSIMCPEPVTAEATEGTSALVILGAAEATDACSSQVEVSSPTQTLFPVGTTEVTYTATDAAGNSATCTTTVTVTLDRALLGNGNGCSSTDSGPSSLAMMGLGVLAALLARKRIQPVLLAVGVVLLSARASAQPVPIPSFELELLKLNPSGKGSLLLGTGELPPDGEYRFSLTTHYENDPLVLFLNGEKQGSVVRHRATAHLAAAYGLWGWIELGAQVPVLLFQRGDDLMDRGVDRLEGGPVPGTPLVTLRVKLLAQREEDPVDLSLGVHAGPSVGNGAALAKELRATPSLMAGRRFGSLRAAIDAGILLRPRTILSRDDDIQDEIGHALRLGGTLSSLGEGLRGELAVITRVPLKREGSSIETLAGARWPVSGSFEAYGLAGLAFGSAPGTPDFRVLLGVAYGRTRPAPVASIQPEPVPEAPELPDLPMQDGEAVQEKDSDGDDILDENDACPVVAGIPEMRGCPARDTDQDTVQDHQDNCPEVAGPVENQGCPAEEKQLVAIQKDRIEIKETVHFDFDKATIQSRSFPLLDQVARILTEHPEILWVTIEGHTDERGSAEYNRDLSQRRAEAVRDYLAGKGVARERMEARGFGEDRPVQSNATDEGRAANRRVEFITSYEQKRP